MMLPVPCQRSQVSAAHFYIMLCCLTYVNTNVCMYAYRNLIEKNSDYDSLIRPKTWVMGKYSSPLPFLLMCLTQISRCMDIIYIPYPHYRKWKHPLNKFMGSTMVSWSVMKVYEIDTSNLIYQTQTFMNQFSPQK